MIAVFFIANIAAYPKIRKPLTFDDIPII